MGQLRACYLATLGKIEEAYLTLEDTISLVEQAFAMSDGAVLKSRTPALPTLEFIIEKRKTGVYYSFDGGNEQHELWGVDPGIAYKRMTSDPRWAWYEPIRGDERFKSLAERVKKLAE